MLLRVSAWVGMSILKEEARVTLVARCSCALVMGMGRENRAVLQSVCRLAAALRRAGEFEQQPALPAVVLAVVF